MLAPVLLHGHESQYNKHQCIESALKSNVLDQRHPSGSKRAVPGANCLEPFPNLNVSRVVLEYNVSVLVRLFEKDHADSLSPALARDSDCCLLTALTLT